MQRERKNWSFVSLLAISVFIVIIDQISKHVVRSTMDLHESVPIIKNFFHITYVSNDGMVFGINFPGSMYILTIISFILTIIFLIYFWRVRYNHIILRIGLALIIGGAIGNFIDRVLFKTVVDMFDFIFGSYHFYIFNVADSAVTVGMVFYLIYSFFLNKDSETNKSVV